MRLKLHIWRQSGPKAPGRFVEYEADDVSPDMSFLEMLDELNEKLQREGQEPIVFDHDCREGICGSCGMVIDGRPHGPQKLTTTSGAGRSAAGATGTWPAARAWAR